MRLTRQKCGWCGDPVGKPYNYQHTKNKKSFAFCDRICAELFERNMVASTQRRSWQQNKNWEEYRERRFGPRINHTDEEAEKQRWSE